MKCSECKFWQKSKMYGNHCRCLCTKPCEVDRHDKQYKARKKKKMERYDKSMRKVRMIIIERCGFSGWAGNSFLTYLFFGRYWLHINKRFKWPLISFVRLPF